MFNHSITKGKFLQTLKHATVIPIYKISPKDNVGNYRSISLPNVFDFWKLMKKKIYNFFLENKSIINSRRFGVRQGLSTFNPLNTFIEDVYRAIDSQQLLQSIYINFSKTFDTVKHEILQQKLNFYGIRAP